MQKFREFLWIVFEISIIYTRSGSGEFRITGSARGPPQSLANAIYE